jgi:alpha-L-fucosidase
LDLNVRARFIKIQANSSYGDAHWGLGKLVFLRDHSQDSEAEAARLELKVQLLTASALPFYNYTDGSWLALASAMNTARELLDGESEDLPAIVAAVRLLQEGRAGLIVKMNLAQNATGSASEFYGEGYEAQKALDGNFDTRWASTLEKHFWYKADLGEAKAFNQIMIFETKRFAGRIYKTVVSVSDDGVTWTPWQEKESGDYYIGIVGERVTKRYILLDFPDCSSNGINIDELFVFEDATAIESPPATPRRPEDPSWIVQMPGTTPNIHQIEKAGLMYGMFIHYGINTFLGQEWTDGSYPASAYHPNLETLDPDSWVKAAYEGGMNFVVLVTKHHDGFALWNTSAGDYNINHTGREGDRRDIVKEVAEACEKYGLKMGLYYSAWDRNWDLHHTRENTGLDREALNQRYNDFALAQITELLDGRYGEICELWIDGAWVKKNYEWEFARLYNTVKALQPGCQFGVNCTIDGLLPNQYQGGEDIYFFPSDFRLFDPNFTRPGANADPKVYTHDGKDYYLPFEATICINNSWFWAATQNAGSVLPAGDIKKAYNHIVEQENTLVINLSPNTDGVLNTFDVNGLLAGAQALGIGRQTPLPATGANPDYRAHIRDNKLFLSSGSDSSCEIYNAAGLKVMRLPLREGETKIIDVPDFQGIYILKFISGNHSQIIKAGA